MIATKAMAAVLGGAVVLMAVSGAFASHNGVPYLPITDWVQDVELWWANHYFNPESPSFDKTIISPSPVINLSAGGDINAAVASLGASGGTVELGAGAYNMGTLASELKGKEHIHIVAPNRATVNGWIDLKPCPAFTNYTDFQDGVYSRDQDCLDCFGGTANRATRYRDYYFKNLDFNGGAASVITANTVRDVMFDGCTVSNYSGSGYRNLIWFGATHRNIWFWDCDFTNNPDQNSIARPEGAKASGFVRCYGDSGIGGPQWNCNDDFSLDINGDGIAQPTENQMGEYNIIYECTFGGSDDYFMTSHGANLLAKNNQSGVYNYFWKNVGKAPHQWASIQYEYYNNKAIGNVMDRAVVCFMLVDRYDYGGSPPLGVHYEIGNYELRGNTINSSSTFTSHTGDTASIHMEDTIICGNCNGGSPQSPDGACPAESNCGGCTASPDTPTGLTVGTVTENTVALDWAASAGCPADYYNVYRNAGTTPVGTTVASAFTDTALAGGTTYTYTVSGENSYGESSQSAFVTATTLVPDTEAPDVPTGLTIDAIDTQQAMLSWLPADDNVETTGYRVFRNSSSIGTTTGESYTDTAVTSCATYSYTVTAFDASANESAQSSPAVGTTGAELQDPDLVTDGVVDAADLAVMAAHWLGSGCGIAGDLDASGEVDLNDLSAFAAAWTGPDTDAPTVPTGLVVDSVTDTTVALNWVDSNDTIAVTGYRVFRDGGSVGTIAGSAYTDTGLANETSYTYTVSAFDAAANESGQSDSVTATTQAPITNLLANGSFEEDNDSNNYPDHWGSRSSTHWATTTAHTGSASLRVDDTESGDIFISQTITGVPTTGSCTLGAWIKTEGATGDGLFIRYANTGGGGGDWGTWGNRVTGTTDWVQRTVGFTAPTDSGRVDLHYGSIGTGGSGWFDDVVLEAD